MMHRCTLCKVGGEDLILHQIFFHFLFILISTMALFPLYEVFLSKSIKRKITLHLDRNCYLHCAMNYSGQKIIAYMTII